jgi:hypothetical protein
VNPNATVTVVSVATTTDPDGNATVTEQQTTLDWALIAPRTSAERADASQPAVVTAAQLYGRPFDVAIDADDTIRVADHSPAMNGDWRVEGMPGPWSIGSWQPGFEVALRRTS